MKSRIKLDVGYDGKPEIKLEVSNNVDDVRDKLLNNFIDDVTYANSYKKVTPFDVPKNCFVIEERFEPIGEGHAGTIPCSSSEGSTEDRLKTYTLIPINRVDMGTARLKKYNKKGNKSGIKYLTIADAIQDIKDFYNFLQVKTDRIDYIENFLNNIPDLKDKLNEFMLVKYEDDIHKCANIKDCENDEVNYFLGEKPQNSVENDFLPLKANKLENK